MPLATRAPVWVEWWPAHEPHGHMLLISEGNEVIEDRWTALEDWATELADAVSRCSEERFKGHGKTHSVEDAKAAFAVAMTMLLTKDYEKDWEELEAKQRAYKRWGGPVPAAVIMPTGEDPKKLVVIMPDKEGTPYVYKVRKGVMDGVILPPDFKTAYRDPSGLGWMRKRQVSLREMMRRRHR